MNEIFERTSIRQYSDTQVSDEDVRKVLQAGMAAPSACNAQPWRFLVLRDKDNLEKYAGVSPYAHFLKDASFGVVVFGDRNMSKEAYILQDCSAACENMLLEAVTLGFGGCWLGICPEKPRMAAVRELSGVPENLMPICILSFGYPKTAHKPMDKFDTDKIYYEHY